MRAEDARLLGHMPNMRNYYKNLQELNRILLVEYLKRKANHEELLASLKEVNNIIQHAARLRVGGQKAKLIQTCREAIKNKNVQLLFKVIKEGAA